METIDHPRYASERRSFCSVPLPPKFTKTVQDFLMHQT